MVGRKLGAVRAATRTSTATQVCGFVALLAVAISSAPQRAWAGWPAVNGADNQRYSPLAQINTKTVAKLGAVQVIAGIAPATSNRTTPVIDGGVMFMTSLRAVYAVDIASGKIVWHADPGAAPSRGGVAVGGGLVFVGAGGPGDANLVALNEKTGEIAWKAPLSSPTGEMTGSASGAPLYADGVVSIGTNADFGYRGQIVAIDAKTGKEAWRFYVVPSPGQPGSETWPKDNNSWMHGGGAIWLDGVYDAKQGVQIYGTGNAVAQYGGEVRQGDNLYTDSVIALDNKTGQLRWHYQIVHHDIWEADIAQTPVLFDATVNGQTRKAVAAMRTDGYLFMLDRTTGKPLGSIEERPVPQDAYQKTSKTQPYPVGAEPVLPDCDYWKTQTLPAGFDLGCFFTAASVEKSNLLAPVYGMRATPMAFDPQTRFFYATGGAGLQWFRRSTDPNYYNLGFSSKVPGLNKLGYGVLAAIDSRTGKIAWQHKYTEARPSGALATAGGLLFQTMGDGELQAYDARTGEILWRFQMGATAGGPPIAFEQGGQEYIASVTGGSVWLFKLGGTLPQRTAPKSAPSGDFAGPIADKANIETSTILKDMGLGGQRVIQDEYQFEPYRTRVKAWTKVSWRNNGVLDHTIVAVDGSWSTDTLHPADIGAHVFDKPGVYVYRAKEFPWVYGEITVTPASPATAPAGQ